MTYAEYCATKGIAPKPYLDEQRDQFEQFLNEKYDAAFNEGTYLHKCLEQASLRSAELERENAELRKDKARLDWLELSDAEISSELLEDDPKDEDTEYHDGWAVYATPLTVDDKRKVVSATADNLRDAIDVAMQSAGEQE